MKDKDTYLKLFFGLLLAVFIIFVLNPIAFVGLGGWAMLVNIGLIVLAVYVLCWLFT